MNRALPHVCSCRFWAGTVHLVWSAGWIPVCSGETFSLQGSSAPWNFLCSNPHPCILSIPTSRAALGRGSGFFSQREGRTALKSSLMNENTSALCSPASHVQDNSGTTHLHCSLIRQSVTLVVFHSPRAVFQKELGLEVGCSSSSFPIISWTGCLFEGWPFWGPGLGAQVGKERPISPKLL